MWDLIAYFFTLSIRQYKSNNGVYINSTEIKNENVYFYNKLILKVSEVFAELRNTFKENKMMFRYHISQTSRHRKKDVTIIKAFCRE